MSISIGDALTMNNLDGTPRRDMRPRNDKGQLLKKDESQSETTTVEATRTEFTPILVWTAGPGMPQERIWTEKNYAGLTPERDGAYHIKTQEQLDTIKRALGNRYWPTNIPDGEPSLKCDTCQWQCRSLQAFMTHSNQAHGRPQG